MNDINLKADNIDKTSAAIILETGVILFLDKKQVPVIDHIYTVKMGQLN